MKEKFHQLDEMRLGVAYRGTIRLRGFTMECRPLSIAETIQVASEVRAEMDKLPPAHLMSLTEATLLAQKTLMQASTTEPDSKDYAFSELIARRMTPDELQALYNQYVDLCNRVNPELEMLPKEKVDELVEAVKKNPSGLLKLSRSELLPILHSLLFPVNEG